MALAPALAFETRGKIEAIEKAEVLQCTVCLPKQTGVWDLRLIHKQRHALIQSTRLNRTEQADEVVWSSSMYEEKHSPKLNLRDGMRSDVQTGNQPGGGYNGDKMEYIDVEVTE